ncbi:hypothetical protein Tco_1032551 [Tanacetum coccineum]|uniref:Uncharacterized protein n=1 Tax=Tanacetum coccineum TaxID=301880 RepID=A0ABQ5GC58_9ASTR
MMSGTIKASADYLIQPGKGRGKGLITKKFVDSEILEETKEDEEESHLNERQYSLVIGREVDMETDKGTLDHSTMK